MMSKDCVLNVIYVEKINAMPANMPKFQVNAIHPGETYGIDVAEYKANNTLCVHGLQIMLHFWKGTE